MVERTVPDGLNIPVDNEGANACGGVIARNAKGGVTWVQSFVSSGERQTFCIHDAPSPEAIRRPAQKRALPVNRITEVPVVDPYFYH